MNHDELKQAAMDAAESFVEDLAGLMDGAESDHDDELLDVSSERDHLAAELEIARERIAELERQLEKARGVPTGSCGDRCTPALDTRESRADFEEANQGRKELFA